MKQHLFFPLGLPRAVHRYKSNAAIQHQHDHCGHRPRQLLRRNAWKMRSRLALEIDPRLYSQQFVRAAYRRTHLRGRGRCHGIRSGLASFKLERDKWSRPPLLNNLFVENKQLMFISHFTHFHLQIIAPPWVFGSKQNTWVATRHWCRFFFFAPKQVLDVLDIRESASGRPCVFDQRSKITKMDHAHEAWWSKIHRWWHLISVFDGGTLGILITHVHFCCIVGVCTYWDICCIQYT